MRALSALLVAVATTCAPAHATSLVRLDEATMAARADHIVRGTVLSVESAYRAGPISVFTDVALEVEEVLKGEDVDGVLHLSLPGGELDGRVYSVAGTPRFAPGDQVLVFLTRLSTGEVTLLGFSQGRYVLTPDASTGALMATRSTQGVHLAAPGGGRQAQGFQAGGVDQEPWAVLRDRLRARLAGGER